MFIWKNTKFIIEVINMTKILQLENKLLWFEKNVLESIETIEMQR